MSSRSQNLIAKENKSKAEQIFLGDWLRPHALHYLNFLQVIAYDFPTLSNTNNLRYVLYRYETLWLPLAAKHIREVLSAPLDIEWI